MTTTFPNPPAPGGRVWAYAGTVLGALTSVAANIADAYVPPHGWHPARPGLEWSPEVGAVVGAVFWPMALLAASETLARKRWANPVTRRVGIAAVLVVASAAAVISYQHMHALLQHYQESDLSATIGPLAIDGLMIVCSLALVAKDAPEDTGQDTGQDSGQDTTGQHDAGQPSGSSPTPDPTPGTTLGTDTTRSDRELRTRTTGAERAPCPARTGVGSDTAAKVARLRAGDPDITQTEAAKRLGLSVRTIRRYWPTTTTDPDGPAPIPTLPTTNPTTTETEPGGDASQAA